jgi:branched-chain amino acid transport system substrate-binding protein
MIEPLGWAKSIFERGYKYVFLSSGVTAETASYSLYGFIKTLPEEIRPKTYVITVSTLLIDTSFGKGWRTYAKELGMEELLYEEFSPTATDLTPLYLKVKELKPDLVFVSCINEPTLMLAVRTMNKLGITPKVIYGLDTFGIPRIRKELGPLAKYIMFDVTYHPTFPFPGAKEFAERFKKAAGYLPETHSATSFAACQLLQAAVEGTRSLDNDKIREYLLTHEIMTIQGPMSFNPNGTPKKPVVYHAQWQEREETYEILWPPEYKTADAVYPFKWGA